MLRCSQLCNSELFALLDVSNIKGFSFAQANLKGTFNVQLNERLVFRMVKALFVCHRKPKHEALMGGGDSLRLFSASGIRKKGIQIKS